MTTFYFTGTGNSLTVAKAIKKELNCELVSVSDASKSDKFYEDDVIGIVTPVYFGDIPDFTADFLEKIRLKPEAYIFAVVTNGGAKGRALARIHNILGSRTLSLDFGADILLPDNYIFTGTSKPKREKIFAGYPEALEKILDDLKKRKTNGEQFHGKYHSFPTRISKKLFDLIYRGSSKTVDQHQCSGCGLCEKVCPLDNISKVNGRYQIGNRCADCMACAQWCPQKAVYYGNRNAAGKWAYTHPDVDVRDIIAQKSL